MADNSAQRYDPDDPVRKKLDDWPELKPDYKPPKRSADSLMDSMRRRMAAGSSVEAIVKLMKQHTKVTTPVYFKTPRKPPRAPRTSVYFEIPKEDNS